MTRTTQFVRFHPEPGTPSRLGDPRADRSALGSVRATGRGVPTARAKYVGIDVGARRLHFAAIDERSRVVESGIFDVGDVVELVETLASAATIAIDAPAELSSAPHAGDDALSPKFRVARCAEIALGRGFGCWVPWVTPTTSPEGDWMATGFALYTALGSAGQRPIEVFPHAAFRELTRPARLPKKQTRAGVQARVDALRRVGVEEPSVAAWNHDHLDALVAAVVARDHQRGTARAATCGHDGSAIWLPALLPQR